MTKILEPALTPQDAPWARQVNQRQGDAEAQIAALQVSLNSLRASLNGLGGATAQLLTEYAPMRTIRSFAAAGFRDEFGAYPLSFQTWTETPETDPGPWYGAITWGEPVAFTLDRRRFVYIEYGVIADVRARTGPSAPSYEQGMASISVRIYVNGERVTEISDIAASAEARTAEGPNKSTNAEGQPRMAAMIDLPEGDHTVQGALQVNVYSPGGGPASLASVYGWDLKVEIGEPAEPDGTASITPSDPGDYE